MAGNLENKCRTVENQELDFEEQKCNSSNRKIVRRVFFIEENPNPEAQEPAHNQFSDPNNAGKNLQENLASSEYLLGQIEALRYQFKIVLEQNEFIKLFHQDERVKVRVQLEKLQKQHNDQLRAKDTLIKHLKMEKAKAYSNLKEKAMGDVKEEIKEQTTAIAFVRGQLETANTKVQALMDQITVLTQDLKKEQQEKEDLRVLVATFQPSLNENEELKNALDIERKATKKAQDRLRKTETQNQQLTTEVTSLKSALEKEKNTKKAQAKLEGLEREQQQQATEETSLESALSEERAKLQTLQGKKVDLEATVTKLGSSLSEEKCAAELSRSTVTEQKATTQALNQRLQTERLTFYAVIEKCNTAWVSALAEKDQLRSTEEQKRNVLHEKIKEISEALISSDETNSALKRQNQELQDHMTAMEVEWLETINRRKRRWWFFHGT